MDRRKFLSTLIGGVAATAAVRTFPFRVFSFPKEIIIPDAIPCALALEGLINRIPTVDVPTLSLHGLIYDPDFYNATGAQFGIRRTTTGLTLSMTREFESIFRARRDTGS